ncbi:unnamed protein product [Closterium sp. Naga37s-1]|nr:unnamed protein product [Closterium sp. Naga37s-1]
MRARVSRGARAPAAAIAQLRQRLHASKGARAPAGACLLAGEAALQQRGRAPAEVLSSAPAEKPCSNAPAEQPCSSARALAGACAPAGARRVLTSPPQTPITSPNSRSTKGAAGGATGAGASTAVEGATEVGVEAVVADAASGNCRHGSGGADGEAWQWADRAGWGRLEGATGPLLGSGWKPRREGATGPTGRDISRQHHGKRLSRVVRLMEGVAADAEAGLDGGRARQARQTRRGGNEEGSRWGATVGATGRNGQGASAKQGVCHVKGGARRSRRCEKDARHWKIGGREPKALIPCQNSK